MPEDRLRFELLTDVSSFACALYVRYCDQEYEIDKAA
jgi:hypothetical protein